MYAKSGGLRHRGESKPGAARSRTGGKSPVARVRSQHAVDGLKTVLAVSSTITDPENALARFAHAFGYPVEMLPAASPEVSSLLENGSSAAQGNTSYGLLPSDVLDVALLHDEWASFQDSSTCSFTVFSIKRSSGQWHPQGVLATSAPHAR